MVILMKIIRIEKEKGMKNVYIDDDKLLRFWRVKKYMQMRIIIILVSRWGEAAFEKL